MGATKSGNPVLYALLGIGRAGKIFYTALFVLAVPAVMAWFILIPRLQFHEIDEQLFRAARHGDVAGIEQALDAGAAVNRASPIDGKTALFRAAVFGHADAVRTLLTRGADPAKVGNDGKRALEVVTAAIGEEHDQTVAQSLETVATALQTAESK